MSRLVWDLRTDKVVQSIKDGKRLDGRAFDEYRKIELLRAISKNADGSARAKIGETDVLVGVKLSLGEPFPDTPNEGTISVGAELLPLASPVFEAGPPDEASIELARVVDRGIRESKALDFEKLCIKEGEQVWIVFIDMYAINYDGNLFDASSIAAISSLLETRIPKLEDEKIVPHEYDGKLKVGRKPLLCTLAKVADSVLLDPNLAEEKASTARFSTATTEDELLTAFQKGGSGSFTAKEIDYCIETALKKGKELRKLL